MVSFIVITTILPESIYSQERKDKLLFKNLKNEFWEQIQKENTEFKKVKNEEKLRMIVDLTNYNLPKSVDEFDKIWHNPPISQGNSGMCWDFSATSFFESEIYRLNKIKVKLSEPFTAYWAYVEKAKEFVKTRGNSTFGQGSEANDVKKSNGKKIRVLFHLVNIQD